MNTGKVVISILAAATVGAALGILLAPDNGVSSRKRIIKEGKKYFDDAMGKYNDIVSEVNETFETLKQNTEEMLANGKERIPVTRKENA